MNRNKSLAQSLHDIAIIAIQSITGIVPKKKHLILFSAWNGQKYADSSMYMYEYFLPSKEYEVYWYTKNKSLYRDLIKKKIPVVYAKSMKGIWLQMRAKMLVSSIQMADFSPYFLNSCIYFDLGHGFPIKQSGFEQPDVTPRTIQYTMLLRRKVDYYMASASEFESGIIQRCFDMDLSHIVKCNKPRIDTFYDEELREGKNGVVEEIKSGRKMIVYMPTHRSGGKIPICVSEIFDLKEIDRICEENNAVFVIKKHFFHRNESENLDDYDNIYDITSEDIETQTLLYQADVLVSDYSACYIDYLMLDRPIMLHAYDYDSFINNERNLYFKFEDNNVGYKSFNKNEFTQYLQKITRDWKDVEHSSGRKCVREMYFDEAVRIPNNREKIKSIMVSMINGTYNGNQ